MPESKKPVTEKPAETTKTAEVEDAKPKAHPNSPVHTMAADVEVTVPAITLWKLGLASKLKISEDLGGQSLVSVSVGDLRKAGFADTPKKGDS